MCRSRTKHAQHVDSSTGKAFAFSASSRVAALVTNLNYREFYTPKGRARTGNEKSSKKFVTNNFFIERKYSRVTGISARSIREGSSAHRQAMLSGSNPRSLDTNPGHFCTRIYSPLFLFLRTGLFALPVSRSFSAIIPLSIRLLLFLILLSRPSGLFVQPFNPFQPFFYRSEQGVGE